MRNSLFAILNCCDLPSINLIPSQWLRHCPFGHGQQRASFNFIRVRVKHRHPIARRTVVFAPTKRGAVRKNYFTDRSQERERHAFVGLTQQSARGLP